MSTPDLEKTRSSLRAYCAVLQVCGWVLLSAGVLLSAWYFVAITRVPVPIGDKLARYLLLPQTAVHYLFPGIFSLGVAQVIRYIFERQYQATWILRKADKILYVCAASVLVAWVLTFIYFLIDRGFPGWELTRVILFLVPQLLILIGLGRVWRLVMPMIEESRTTV